MLGMMNKQGSQTLPFTYVSISSMTKMAKQSNEKKIFLKNGAVSLCEK